MPHLATAALSLLALVVLAGAGGVTAYAILSGRRVRLADHRRILADCERTTGQVVAIGAADADDRCPVTLEYLADGATQRVVQDVATAAIAALGLVPGTPLAVCHRRTRAAVGFAPSLVLAAYTPPPQLAPGLAGQPTLFAVAFADPHAASILVPQSPFGWTAGELMITETTVQVRALRVRPFRKPRLAGRAFPLEAVCNVERLGLAVAFDLLTEAGSTTLTVWTVDEASAADLARRLPASRTATFVPRLAEARDFERRLAGTMPAPAATTGLVVINLVLFAIAGLLGAGWFSPDPDRLVALGSNYTTLTLGGQWWRLLSNAFLHFGLAHVAFNMLALYLNGPFAERLYGSTRYLLIYLAAAVGASLASLWWHPLANSAGASGAIFGVYGATLAFFVRAPLGMPEPVATRHRNRILLFIILTLLLGATSAFVDHAAHLGGLVVGFALGCLGARPLGDPRTDPAHERPQLIGIGVAVAAAIAVGVLGGPTTEAISAKVAGGVPGVLPHPTLTTVAGVHLGETRAELEAARGAPPHGNGHTALYDLDPGGHGAVLEVTFRYDGTNAAPTDRVGAVFYHGDKAHAPPELLYVTGQPHAQLVADFGQAAWLLHARDGISYEMYADGLTVEFEHNRARAYGVQDYYRTLRD